MPAVNSDGRCACVFSSINPRKERHMKSCFWARNKVWLAGLSALCLVALLLRVDGWLWGGCMLGAACALRLVFKNPRRLDTAHIPTAQKLAALVLSFCYVSYFVILENISVWAVLLGLLGFPAMWIFVANTLHSAFNALRKPIAGLNRWVWLLILAAGAFYIMVVYHETTMFYRPHFEGGIRWADRLFTMDTGAVVTENVWLNLNATENDFRQPLFALFAMPASIPLHLLSQLFSFIPDFYVYSLAAVQWGMLVLCYAMLCEMLDSSDSGIRWMCLAVLLGSYPTLIFMLNMEQYIFGLFWMVSFLYAYHYGFGGRKLLCIAAAGSLMTSGLWEPLMVKPWNWREWLKETALALGLALLLIAGSGQLALLDVLEQQTGRYASYFGDSGFADKLLQYINFIGSCLAAPLTRSHDINGTWRLVPVTYVNMAGVALLALTLAGLALYWKKPLMKMCSVWVGFSAVLLLGLGWGSAENGMTLYTLYFGWAFLLPAALAFRRMTEPLGRWRKWLLAACGLAILAVNGVSMLRLLRFACRIYPR